jgi:hypothetical protein
MKFRALQLAVALGALGATGAHAQKAPAAPVPAAPATSPIKISKEAFLANSGTEFGRIDANKDGKLSKAELEQNDAAVWLAQARARNKANFNALDRDRNGSLSPDEFAAAIGRPPAFNVAAGLARLDTDRDSQISREEFRTGASANFDRLDTNKDGALSQAEIAAGRVRKPAPVAAR